MKRKQNTHELKMQPTLLHVPAENDRVDTPLNLAYDIVTFFQPRGLILDPCRGNGVFYNLFKGDRDWCEIEEGVDFYTYNHHVDWAVSNPPYSHYSAWIRQSMLVADNIVYLIPVYKVFASNKFLDDMFEWGGIAHIRRYGTGTQWGFPFGQAVAAVYYKRDYRGDTSWSSFWA